MKKLYFGSNLKMYKGIQETEKYLKKLEENTKNINREEMELFIIPSYTSLPAAVSCCDSQMINLGAQNMCWEDQGQFTGEISPCMLKELGIKLVMIGHSERRHVFGESDIEENRKVKSALKHGIRPLLCIGETAEEKKYGISGEILRQQLKIGFYEIDPEECKNIWVAYEPVWSIGVNGIPATAEYAQKMHMEIKKALREIFGDNAEQIPVLYGGSVNPENADQLILQPAIDGLFVGRAAWDAEAFDKLIRHSIHTYKQNNI